MSVPDQVIRDTIARLAAGNGEPDWGDVTYVTTTRKSPGWELAVDPRVAGPDQPVYAVIAHGDYIGYRTTGPRGHTPPTGNYLLATIDIGDGRLVSWGIFKKRPDLSFASGPVKKLADTATQSPGST